MVYEERAQLLLSVLLSITTHLICVLGYFQVDMVPDKLPVTVDFPYSDKERLQLWVQANGHHLPSIFHGLSTNTFLRKWPIIYIDTYPDVFCLEMQR